VKKVLLNQALEIDPKLKELSAKVILFCKDSCSCLLTENALRFK
jgi:hypothetical protein